MINLSIFDGIDFDRWSKKRNFKPVEEVKLSDSRHKKDAFNTSHDSKKIYHKAISKRVVHVEEEDYDDFYYEDDDKYYSDAILGGYATFDPNVPIEDRPWVYSEALGITYIYKTRGMLDSKESFLLKTQPDKYALMDPEDFLKDAYPEEYDRKLYDDYNYESMMFDMAVNFPDAPNFYYTVGEKKDDRTDPEDRLFRQFFKDYEYVDPFPMEIKTPEEISKMSLNEYWVYKQELKDHEACNELNKKIEMDRIMKTTYNSNVAFMNNFYDIDNYDTYDDAVIARSRDHYIRIREEQLINSIEQSPFDRDMIYRSIIDNENNYDDDTSFNSLFPSEEEDDYIDSYLGVKFNPNVYTNQIDSVPYDLYNVANDDEFWDYPTDSLGYIDMEALTQDQYAKLCEGYFESQSGGIHGEPVVGKHHRNGFIDVFSQRELEGYVLRYDTNGHLKRVAVTDEYLEAVSSPREYNYAMSKRNGEVYIDDDEFGELEDVNSPEYQASKAKSLHYLKSIGVIPPEPGEIVEPFDDIDFIQSLGEADYRGIDPRAITTEDNGERVLNLDLLGFDDDRNPILAPLIESDEDAYKRRMERLKEAAFKAHSLKKRDGSYVGQKKSEDVEETIESILEAELRRKQMIFGYRGYDRIRKCAPSELVAGPQSPRTRFKRPERSLDEYEFTVDTYDTDIYNII